MKHINDFPTQLRMQMEERGFTSRALADKSGVSDGAIRCYRIGTRDPSRSNLIKIQYALGCDIKELT